MSRDKQMSRKVTKYHLAFLLPGVMVYTIFLIIPLFLSVYYSFTNWNGLSSQVKMVGLKNYLFLTREYMFIQSLLATFAITALTTMGTNFIGILCAVFLQHKGGFFKTGRTVVFIPAILSPVVVSFIWSYMTQMNNGIINILLNGIGLAPIDFYQSQSSIVLMVSAVISWAALGFYTTIYIANLKAIPRDIYESANIDGASPIRQFFAITLPMLKPAIIINTVTALIWGLKQYDFVKIMVPGHIQTVTVYAIERAFEYNMFGYSSAVVVVLLGITLLVSLLQMKIMNRKETAY